MGWLGVWLVTGHFLRQMRPRKYEMLVLVSELKNRHLISNTPRVMVVDGSKLVRKLITDVLRRELPEVDVIGCVGIAEARQTLEAGTVDLVTTSLFSA